jgi:hypothetical protein
MKLKHVPSLILLTAFLSETAFALTSITERFKATQLNETRWYHYHSDKTSLVPLNGKLNLVISSKPSHTDFTSIELLSSQPGYNEDWQVIVDLANTSKLGNKAGCGLMLFNVADRSDYLFVESYGKSGLAAGMLVDGHSPDNARFSLNVGAPKGALRVRFNAATKLLTFYVSATGFAAGYDWKKVGTVSPTGKGGKVNGNWRMSPTNGRFGIQLYGFGDSTIEAGKITLDNFKVSAP